MAFEVDREKWTITDDSAADWALQRIAEEQADAERLAALGEKKIEEIKKSIEKSRKNCESYTNYLKSKLFEYFQMVNHRKTKTGIEKYALLSGTLVMTPPQKKPVKNDEKLVEWLAANGMTDYIKTVQSPAWSELKKQLDLSGAVPVVKETGEVVEGVTLEDVPETFEVKLGKKEGDD